MSDHFSEILSSYIFLLPLFMILISITIFLLMKPWPKEPFILTDEIVYPRMRRVNIVTAPIDLVYRRYRVLGRVKFLVYDRADPEFTAASLLFPTREIHRKAPGPFWFQNTRNCVTFNEQEVSTITRFIGRSAFPCTISPIIDENLLITTNERPVIVIDGADPNIGLESNWLGGYRMR